MLHNSDPMMSLMHVTCVQLIWEPLLALVAGDPGRALPDSFFYLLADERAATGSRPLPRHGEAVAATAAGNKSLSCTQQKCLLPREPPRSRHRTRLDHKYLHPAGNAAPESRRASPPPPARYGAGSTLVAVRGRFEWYWPCELACPRFQGRFPHLHLSVECGKFLSNHFTTH